MIRVALVERAVVVQIGFHTLIESVTDLQGGSGGEEAVRLVRDQRPDIVLMYHLPEAENVRVLRPYDIPSRRIRYTRPSVPASGLFLRMRLRRSS